MSAFYGYVRAFLVGIGAATVIHWFIEWIRKVVA